MSGEGWGGAAEGLGGFFQGMGQVMVQQRMFEQESARMAQMQQMQFANQMSLETMRQGFDREKLDFERGERALDRTAAREALHFEIEKIRETFTQQKGLAGFQQGLKMQEIEKLADIDVGKMLLQNDLSDEQAEKIFGRQLEAIKLEHGLKGTNEAMSILLRGKIEKEITGMNLSGKRDEITKHAESAMEQLKYQMEQQGKQATQAQITAAAIKAGFDKDSDAMTDLILAKMHGVTITKDESGATQIQGSNKDTADFMRARSALQSKGAAARIAGAFSSLDAADPAQAAKINAMFEGVTKADTKALDEVLNARKGGKRTSLLPGSESRPAAAGVGVVGSEGGASTVPEEEEEDSEDMGALAAGLTGAGHKYLKAAFAKANIAPTQKADVLTTMKDENAGGRTLYGTALTKAGGNVLNAMNDNPDYRNFGFDHHSGSVIELPDPSALVWPGSETDKVDKEVTRYGRPANRNPYGKALEKAKEPGGLRELQEKWSKEKVGTAQKPIIRPNDPLTTERLQVLLRLEAADKALVGDRYKKDERAIADQYRIDETRGKLRGKAETQPAARGSESN